MKNKYYTINYELDNDITGKDYPQVNCLNINEIGRFSPWELHKNNPLLKFELKKRCKLTDVLSVLELNTGFLISPKVKAIFDQFKLMQHQYFDANVQTKDGSFNYYWLHLSDPDLTKKIDYSKSVFFETEWSFDKEIIKLDSYEHYQNLKAKDTEASFGVRLDKIILSDSFDEDLDLFKFTPFGIDVYISERLKESLKENNILSFKIEEANTFL